MKIITIAANKGGATKTTAAANMGYYLGTKASTLIVDFDKQGQLALWFGKDPQSDVFDWWTGTKILENSVTAARETGQLWLMLGNSRTAILEMMHAQVTSKEFDQFVAMVKRLSVHFEFVVIDTPPSGILQQVAMAAADEIVVPFVPERPGVAGALETWAMLRKMGHSDHATYLPSNAYIGQKETDRCVAELSQVVGGDHFAPYAIPHRVELTEAVAEGKTIYEYGGQRTKLIEAAYAALCGELVGPFADEQLDPEEVLNARVN